MVLGPVTEHSLASRPVERPVSEIYVMAGETIVLSESYRDRAHRLLVTEFLMMETSQEIVSCGVTWDFDTEQSW